MSYVMSSSDDSPEKAHRPFDAVMEECDRGLSKLAALVGEAEERTGRFRLSMPRPESDQKMVKAARDIHSSAVDQLQNLRDIIVGLQRRLAVLLEELEI